MSSPFPPMKEVDEARMRTPSELRWPVVGSFLALSNAGNSDSVSCAHSARRSY